MTQRIETIAGRRVLIDEPAAPATAADTLLLLHGWPDSAALWDETVAALSARFRCVRFSWPGFASDDARGTHSLAELTALLHQVALQANGGAPVTLVLHDWGCVFGYHFARLHPALVSRVVGIDVGDANSREHRAGLTFKAQLGIAGYQLWLALAWAIGGGVGDRMARRLSAAMRVPRPAEQIHARMGYPYWMAWTGANGGMKDARTFHPQVPMLYLYGRRKPFMFQSTAWTQALAARPGCRVRAMDTRHWVMLDAPAAFQRELLDWLG